MDINTLRGISTLMLLLAFLGLCFWVYSGKRKKHYEEAAQLPFAEDDHIQPSDKGDNNE